LILRVKKLKSLKKLTSKENDVKVPNVGELDTDSFSDSDFSVDEVEVAEKKCSAFNDDFLAYCEAEDNYRNTYSYASGSDSEREPETVAPIMTREHQRERRKLEKDRSNRTLFVGNLPTWITKKTLQRLFSRALRDAEIDSTKCKVESVRIRGAVPTAGGKSKQALKRATIRQEFAAGDKHTLIGFVILTSKEGIPVALKLNGHFLAPKDGSSDAGRHIRVDVSNRQKYNNQNSIFIGNLPFSVNEEEVRKTFSHFGEIKGVRLIRDRATGAVKGIGFVEFEDPSSVQLAVRQSAVNSEGSQALSICGRQVRVQVWKSIKKAKEGKGQTRRRFVSKQEEMTTSVGAFRIPTNIRGEAAKKVFIKRALKKRFERKQKAAKSGVVDGGVKKAKNKVKDKVKKPRHRDRARMA
uniref:RRM domain-containing protein n=1 Tax=Hymenolepis diminuta TaxID=6216 RepID=A0A0R3SCK2_HYMDI